ncbi:MAG: urease accessory protein [Bacteroidota bacterium]
MEELSLLLALVIGFTHAFEADHLIAVGNLVTQRNRWQQAVKDGVYWGLGHTSTILLIGMAMILGRAAIPPEVFGWLEALVGVMLILLGLWRLSSTFKLRQQEGEVHNHDHRLAYGVGLIHGLAGSGAVILLVLTQIEDTWYGLLYLFLFGMGSVGGMLLAAGLLSLPYAKAVLKRPKLQATLVVLSALICVAYGGYVVLDHL